MLQKGIRSPSGVKARSSATPRPAAPTLSASTANPALLAQSCVQRTVRPAVSTSAAAVESLASHDDPIAFNSRVSALRLTAEAESAAAAAASMVTCRFLVPYFVTKPGQQLFLTGSSPELGEWDAALAVPLEWHQGHQHLVTVRLPASRVVQTKLILKENGQVVNSEEGNPRDVMLLPVSQASESRGGQGEKQPAAAGAASESASSVAQVDYQIMCHFGSPEATQILRLPVVLPAKESSDRRVLCKFVVILDNVKLEPRQYPAVVGSAEALGSWKGEGGVKLMRQVGGYWTRRVELPILDGTIQAKVVICNPDGQPAVWEPGTANRMLAPGQVPAAALPPGAAPRGPADAMHIFVCRWGQPDLNTVVSVPVEYENANKEFIKQLDAAQREIGIMRQAVTAKSRQCQSLESELAASRRTERALRDEVTGLRSELSLLMQELHSAQQGEGSARQESAALQEELQRLGENYEREISFLGSKLDEMEQEINSLHEQLAAAGGRSSNGNGNGNNANGTHTDGSFWGQSAATSSFERETPRVMTRSNWR